MARMATSTPLPAALVANDLAFEVLHFLDRTVGENLESVVHIARSAVLEFVGDDPDIVHAGIADRDRQRRKRQVADLQFVIRHAR